MPESSYDCIVIGSGPGGYVAAIRAAQLGMKTAVVEKDRVGGRCLNYACIPAKAVLRAADIKTEVEHGSSMGIVAENVSVDFDGVVKHREKVVKTLTGGVSGLFKKTKIDLIEGFGALTEDANVRIGAAKDGDEIEAGKVILATGSIPKPLLGLQFGGRVLGTETMWAI
ncbi:MAG TPA: FAD-dependent oxidoreductase, partial [Thermoleophilaceae bacterium]